MCVRFSLGAQPRERSKRLAVVASHLHSRRWRGGFGGSEERGRDMEYDAADGKEEKNPLTVGGSDGWQCSDQLKEECR